MTDNYKNMKTLERKIKSLTAKLESWEREAWERGKELSRLTDS